MGFSEVGFAKKPTFTKQEVGFLSGVSKVGFVENYGPSLLHSSLGLERIKFPLLSSPPQKLQGQT